MHMDVDESRGDVVASDVDGFLRLFGRNVFGDAGDGLARDGDIHDAINPVGRIDHVAVFENLVVRLCCYWSCDNKHANQGRVLQRHPELTNGSCCRALRYSTQAC